MQNRALMICSPSRANGICASAIMSCRCDTTWPSWNIDVAFIAVPVFQQDENDFVVAEKLGERDLDEEEEYNYGAATL